MAMAKSEIQESIAEVAAKERKELSAAKPQPECARPPLHLTRVRYGRFYFF
jgi:hypothetical protein